MHVRCTRSYLVFGVLLSLTMGLALGRTYAATYDVTAQVAAPLPTSVVPDIVSPGDGVTQTSNLVVITGTCPVVDPALIVILVRNNQTIGSGLCEASGTFNILVGLVLGENIIFPKFMTVTGQLSGFGEPLRLYYVPAESESSANKLIANPKDLSTSLYVHFDYDFVQVSSGAKTNLQVTVGGGVAPYRLVVHWGDGLYKDYTYDAPGVYTVSHTYGSLSYGQTKMRLILTDKNGQQQKQERALFSLEKQNLVSSVSQRQRRATWHAWILGVTSLLLLLALRHRRGLRTTTPLHANARVAKTKKRVKRSRR